MDKIGNYDSFYLFSVTLMVVGFFLNGYADNNIVVDSERIFPIWYTVLYLGFFLALFSLITPISVNRALGKSWSESIPRYYKGSVVGTIFVLVGVISELIWSNRIGFHHPLEKLVNPPDVLLGIGLFLMISGPHIKMRELPVQSWTEQLNTLFPVILMTAIVLFYTQFASPFTYLYARSIEMGSDISTISNTPEFAIIGFTLTSLILTGAYIYIVRNWNLRIGSTFLFFFITISLISSLNAIFEFFILAFIVGIVMEILYSLYLVNEPEYSENVIAVFIPLTTYTIYYVGLYAFDQLAWSMTLCVAMTMLSISFTLLLSVLMKSST